MQMRSDGTTHTLAAFFCAALAVAAHLSSLGAAHASLSVSEREEIATISQAPPSIDLEVSFESRSSKIRIHSQAFQALSVLGQALSDPSLHDAVFIIAGHAAAEGRSEEYSQELSEQRANAVKRFLIENFEFDPSMLVTVGYGDTKPKDPSDPFASENQRVQILNLSGKTSAPR